MKSLTVRVMFGAILALAIAVSIGWAALESSSAASSVASTQDVSATRAALDKALAKEAARAKKKTKAKVADAFRFYQSSVSAREAEIYRRLKELDVLIAEPPSASSIDDPAQSPYLNPRPEVSGLVAEYDSYRTELSALNIDLKFYTDKINNIFQSDENSQIAADVATACPPITTINGTLGSGSPDFPATSGQQTGRILNGLGNVTCGSSNPCTLNTATGLRAFDAYTFINPGATTACVTVNFAMTGCNLGQAMQFSARIGSFDPANPCANYVGDAGAGFSGEINGSFSFNVPAGETFVVVVNENDPDGATGCAYSIAISGLTCQAACPPSTTINGTLGSGSPDFPATSGQQTGRILNGLGNITCGSSNPCTLNTATGSRAFDAYTFINPGATTACVTVNFAMTGCNLGQAMQFSTRIGSFDSANPCTNYVGDAGAGFSGENNGSFSFNVPAGAVFVVVVNENDPDGAVGCAYSLTISGIDCPVQPCALTCPSNITQSNDPGQCGAVVNFPAPTTTGDCGTVTCNPASGSFFPTGSTNVTCTSAAGPICSFTVTVNDTEKPTITCPANITVTGGTGQATVVVNYIVPSVGAGTVSDNCGVASVVCAPPSGTAFPLGTTTVTCTATDTSGNTAQCSFTVSAFDVCIEDDANPNNEMLFISTGPNKGEYRICCGGVTLTGRGSVGIKKNVLNLVHFTADRSVQAFLFNNQQRATAAVQSPPSAFPCTINDSNVNNNNCSCAAN